MKINPFFLDISFQPVSEGKRGRSLDSRSKRVQDSNPRAGVKVVTQGADASSPKEKLARAARGREGAQGFNPQTPPSALAVLLAGPALQAEKLRAATAKKAQGTKVKRKEFADTGHSLSPATDDRFLPHGAEARPSQRLFISTETKRGRAASGINAGLGDTKIDDGTSGGVMRTKDGQLVKGNTRQTQSDVPAMTTTSSGTGDPGGRAGKPNQSVGNPGGEQRLDRIERQAEKAAQGKHDTDPLKAPDENKTSSPAPFVIDSQGRSIAGYTHFTPAASARGVVPSGNPVPPGLPKRTGLADHGTQARPFLPNSGGKSKADLEVKAAKDIAKGLFSQGTEEAPKGKRKVSAEVLADLRKQNGKP